MIYIAIKYFCICLCCLTVFIKLLNITTTKNNHLLNSLFSMFFATSSVIFRTYCLELSILLLCLLLIIYTYFIYKKSLNITITSTLIAFGISFGLFAFSLILITPIGIIFAPKYYGDLLFLISHLLIGILQNILAVLLFKIKRLKNGMPFLLRKGAGDVGAFISFSLLVAVTFNNNTVNISIRNILILILFFSSFIIYLWWRKRLYSDYLKKLKENDITALKQAIESQEETISKLTATNEEMLKIIQKDNKLIPEMQAAVNDLISKNKTDEAEKLQTQLNTLYDQRLEVLKEYETICNLKM